MADITNDINIKDFPNVTDGAYIPIVLADGSVGKIAKADLASVLGGLITINNNVTADISTNSLTKQGKYIGLPSDAPTTNYVIIEVFTTGKYIRQQAYNMFWSDMWNRVSTDGGATWSGWVKRY